MTNTVPDTGGAVRRARGTRVALVGIALAAGAACSPTADRPAGWTGLDVRPLEIDRTTTASSNARPPAENLIVISIDTLRPDHLGCYGYERPTSPSIDRFAASAIVFEDAYAQSPRTAQSHMTLFTGLYPTEHGVLNFQDGDAERLSDEIPTLATLLRDAGYRTAAITAAGNLAGSMGFDRGFDEFSEDDEGAAVKFAGAQRFLEEVAARDPDDRTPFFLFVHTYDVHDPYLAADPEHLGAFVDPGYAGRLVETWDELAKITEYTSWSRRAAEFWKLADLDDPRDVRHLVDLYDASIRTVDDHVGAFLDRLAALDLDRDTTVVLLSDHGEQFLEHGSTVHKDVYDETLRVPLAIRFANASGLPPARIPGPVRLVDVLPTLLDRLGLAIPEHVQGATLMPLVRDETAAGRPVFAEYAFIGSHVLRWDRWKLIERPAHEGTSKRRLELYDLATDSGERVDLASSRASLAMDLLAEIDRVRTVMLANRDAVESSAPVSVDAETLKQLEALGYVGN